MMTPDEAHAVLSTTTITQWRKSRFSDQQNCVEVGTNPAAADFVGIRDSKLAGASPVLTFPGAEFAAFLAGAKAGEFDDLVD